MNIVYSTAGDKLGTAAKPWAEVHGITVLAGGVALAKVTRPLDQFGTPSDNTDLDATTARHGLMSKLDKVKLDGIAAGAQVNPTDSAIATAYSDQLEALVAQGESVDPATAEWPSL